MASGVISGRSQTHRLPHIFAPYSGRQSLPPHSFLAGKARLCPYPVCLTAANLGTIDYSRIHVFQIAGRMKGASKPSLGGVPSLKAAPTVLPCGFSARNPSERFHRHALVTL